MSAFMFGANALAATGVSVDWLGSFASTPGPARTIHTFSAVPFGTAATDREIFVTVSWWQSAAHTLSSVTIGGSAATAELAFALGPIGGVRCFHLNVTSGTSGNIVVTFGTAIIGCTIGVWRVSGRSVMNATATGTGSNSSASTTSLTINALTVPNNGFLLSASPAQNSGVVMSPSGLGVNLDGQVSDQCQHGFAHVPSTPGGATGALVWGYDRNVAAVAAAYCFGV